MAAPSYDTVQIAFNTMLATLNISTDDTAILNESQNPLIWQSEYAKVDFIQKIDGVVDVLSSLSANVVNILSTRIANIGKCRNAIVPRIHYLPNEIFDNIIAQSSHHTYPPYKQAWSLQRLMTLRRVSTSWNQRMIANGSLWATINDVGMSCRGYPWRTPGRMARLLELSGSIPLQIKFNCPLPAEVIDSMTPHLSRLKHLEMDNSCSGGQSLLMHRMPILESLLLGPRMSSPPLAIVQDFLAKGGAPSLRSLKTSYSELLPSLDPSIASGLKHLELVGVQTSDHLLANLTLCTGLKSLVITRPCTSGIPYSISLPHLESLHIHGNSGTSPTILKAIDAPRCRSFKFDGHDYPDWKRWQTDANYPLTTALLKLAPGNGVVVSVERRPNGQHYHNVHIRSYDRVDLPILTFETEATKALVFLAAHQRSGMPHVARIEAPEVIMSELSNWPHFPRLVRNVEEIGLFPSPNSPSKGMELWKTIVRARHSMLPGPSSSRTAPLRRLDVWDDLRWVDKLDEIEAAVGFKDDGMVVD